MSPLLRAITKIVHLLSRLRARLSYANVTASLALFIALGGTTYAATSLPRNSVGSKQIRTNAVGASELRHNAVRSAEIRNRSINLRDVALSARNSLRGSQGPQGPPGPAGTADRAAINSGGGKVSGTARDNVNHPGGSN